MKIRSHYITIRSAYNEAELSRRRLELLRQITIPCLAAQSPDVVLSVVIAERDPLLAERKALFESTGLQCQFIERPPAALPVTMDNVIGCDQWQIPAGVPTLVMRLDDDDAIVNDYCQATRDYAEAHAEIGTVYIWPNGYLKLRDKSGKWRLRQMRHKTNMFCTLFTDKGESPQDESHYSIVKRRPVTFVNNRRGWLWLRHPDTCSDELVKRCWQGQFEPFPKHATDWAIDLKEAPETWTSN